MKKGMKQTERHSLSPARTVFSALMLFAVLGVMAPAAIDPVPTNLTFTATYGDTNAIPTQTFALTVPADVSATAYVLATTNSWIVSVKNSEGDVSGTVPAGGTTNITVTVTTNGVPVGSYSGNITVGANWSDVSVTLYVIKADQTITFAAIPDQVVTSVVTLSATASSGLSVGFTNTSGPAVITNGNELRFTGTGIVTIVASQAGDANWNTASAVTRTINVQEIYVALTADFDGDGLADPAVYAQSTGNWKLKLSTANYALVPLAGLLGGIGYTALAADFDGDGLADPTIYNAASELWATKLSSLNYLAPTVITSFGGTGWEALAGDFDADGLADPALYNTNGTWKVKLSTANYQTITSTGLLGLPDWTAIAGDFDGDGKVDPTIYNASTGTWIVLLSRANYAVAVLDPDFLGSTGYTGMAADFDNDGYADPTVAQTSTGNWKVKLSSGNYSLLELNGFLGGQ